MARKRAVVAACGLGPAAAAVLVNNCCCRAWTFVLSLAKSHQLVEVAGDAGERLVLPQWTGVRENGVSVTETRI